MLDALIAVVLVLLPLRGWYRGFVHEAMDLAGLLLGTVLAFRLGPAVGSVVAAMARISDDAARLIGGLMVLFATGIGAALATRVLERRFRLPGLNLINRTGGAVLALGFGAFLVILLLSLAVILPLPPGVSDTIDDSAIARSFTDPDGAPQEVFRGLSGDSIVSALLNLREVVGARRVVIEGDETVEFPAADPDRLDPDPDSASEIYRALNLARVQAGVDPLAFSPALALVAEAHAAEMYAGGYFSHVSPLTGDVGDRLADAGIVFSVAGENLALAATPSDVHDGLMDSEGHRRNLLHPDYRRVGVAVVKGPLGLMTVQVFTG
jgi:hypothetical protein